MLRSTLVQGTARVIAGQRRSCQSTRIVEPRKAETVLSPGSLAYLEEMSQRIQQGEEVNVTVRQVVESVEGALSLDEPIISREFARPTKDSNRSATPQEIRDAIKVAQMIRAFSVRGHFMCDLDPLGLLKGGIDRSGEVPGELTPDYFGFTESDMDKEFLVQMHEDIGGIFSKGGSMTLSKLLEKLKDIYCGRIGWEFMHIPDRECTKWLRERLELPEATDLNPSIEDKKSILKDLAVGELFEQFLHVKYPTKRFGLDGGDALIPGMMAMIERCADDGVSDVVIGMSHRGRLNVLANVCGKPLTQILHEFEDVLPENSFGSGDVKYHLGTVQDRVTKSGKPIRVSLVANPSHLEAVNPVVAGKTRAKQRYAQDHDGSRSVPILLHGDAAFSGQGVCYETSGLANLYRYTCGGTIHIVVNNQIGFTTNPQENRSSPYCTDIGKQGHPVFHVNGDDPESVVRVCKMAVDYRQKFKSDVIIDLVCYRRNGHNEKDEPMFTQPMMYQAIKDHPSVLTLYEKKLIEEGSLTKKDTQAVRKEVDKHLKEQYKSAKSYIPDKNDWLESKWEFYRSNSQLASLRSTGVSVAQLQDIGKKLYEYPEGFVPHPKLKGILKRSQGHLATGESIEWGTAEALALGTLLLEGNHVRLSGQDVERGTFSHRHAVIHDYNTADTYCPLGNLHSSQAHFEVCNSSLSEYGVLGFEVGYSMENPASLVLWEAQFGDFANGAQVIFDQFLSSGEEKWVRQCGLVVLLPHGYDGQGPEHSSSRIERYLIASDEDETGPKGGATNSEEQILRSNWQVCSMILFSQHAVNSATPRGLSTTTQHSTYHQQQVCYPSTPANYFHMLRRQLHREFRKPLIVAVYVPSHQHPHMLHSLQLEGIPAGTERVAALRLLAGDVLQIGYVMSSLSCSPINTFFSD